MNAQDWFSDLQMLEAAIVADPVLRLAASVARFDPLWRADDDPYGYGDLDALEGVLGICRTCFPVLYAQAVSALRRGAGAETVTDDILQGISAMGIPVSYPENLWYGIPIPAMGTTLIEPDWHAARPDLTPVVTLFGVLIDLDAYQVDIPNDACDAALLIAASLAAREEEPYQNLSCLVQWLWGISGNSAVDWSDDMLYESHPLAWTPENVALAQEIIAEADELLDRALAGLKLFQENATLRATLRRNITITRRKLKGRNAYHVIRSSDNNTNPFRLAWPGPG